MLSPLRWWVILPFGSSALTSSASAVAGLFFAMAVDVHNIAKFNGAFVLGVGAVPGDTSVHLLEWEGSGRQQKPTGVHGWVRCLGSFPLHAALPANNFRVHVCGS